MDDDRRLSPEEYIFQQVAANGQVVDKDGVANALKGLRELYKAIGVSNSRAPVEDLKKDFFNGDSLTQVKTGGIIFSIYEHLSDAVRILTRRKD